LGGIKISSKQAPPNEKRQKMIDGYPDFEESISEQNFPKANKLKKQTGGIGSFEGG